MASVSSNPASPREVFQEAGPADGAGKDKNNNQASIISRTWNAVKGFFNWICKGLNYVFVAKGLNDACSFAKNTGVKGTVKHVVGSAWGATKAIARECSSQGVKDAYNWTEGKASAAYSRLFSTKEADETSD